MNASDLKELEQLALLAELARPIAHETNNFLNNLLLQLAISEKSFPEPIRADWHSIRREGRKLADLLQQWQRQRKPGAEEPGPIDLNKVMHEMVHALRPEAGAIVVVFKPAAEAVRVAGFAGDVQRLFLLLLRFALAGSTGPAIEVRLEKCHARVILRILDAHSSDANIRWSDFEDIAPTERSTLSLPALACRALVERLGGRVGIEKDAAGRLSLAIDLPLAF